MMHRFISRLLRGCPGYSCFLSINFGALFPLLPFWIIFLARNNRTSSLEKNSSACGSLSHPISFFLASSTPLDFPPQAPLPQSAVSSSSSSFLHPGVGGRGEAGGIMCVLVAKTPVGADVGHMPLLSPFSSLMWVPTPLHEKTRCAFVKSSRAPEPPLNPSSAFNHAENGVCLHGRPWKEGR